jgi:hypothetical protein
VQALAGTLIQNIIFIQHIPVLETSHIPSYQDGSLNLHFYSIMWNDIVILHSIWYLIRRSIWRAVTRLVRYRFYHHCYVH